MTKLEIIKETVDFYSADVKRRSLNEKGSCVYNGENGTHCAVGRCLLPTYHEMGSNLLGNGNGYVIFFKKNGYDKLDEMLQDQYRGHELEFWGKLQNLHDITDNWNESGLTLQGQDNLDSIMNQFNLK